MEEALKGKIGSLKKRRISAVENVEGFLKVISHKNKAINAFLHVNEAAVEDAENVDKKLKKGASGRLAGLAIAVKSNINVTGLPITCASKTLEEYYGSYDADAIRKIRAEDGIIIGMTNMDEFACGNSGETSAFGSTDNPSAPGMIPGGTSSGSAAALAAGMCDLALGSDTGGSIRNPASHCGVVGIKPSYGRVSRFGLIDSAMSFDQIGAMAKDAYGCALLMEVMAGRSDYDATSVNAAVPEYTAHAKKTGQSIGNLRIGLSRDFERLCTDKRIYGMISGAAKSIAAKTSSKIVNVDLKYVDLSVQAYYPIQYVEFFSGTRKFDGRRYGKRIEDSCGEEVLRRILGGMEISKAEYQGTYYRKALMAKRLITRDFEDAFKKADVILLPTTPVLPHKLGAKITDLRTVYAYDAFTIPANLAGICAGVVGAGRIGGVPVGLQIMAPAFREELLLQVMAACEKPGGSDGGGENGRA
ncbi:Asp-tRNA(Asn)/Glu-tRNA(Gln) amidotransferase subunit GatA [Candidatus Woesearchaeota archaeon]|nr:Asp-tRNA(Asn)/Glu-tRNA(Gln) amidotransferase subunit GatA [Candidatus Woesearchaeota archaeon]